MDLSTIQKELEQKTTETTKTIKDKAKIGASRFLETPIGQWGKKVRDRWNRVINGIWGKAPKPLKETTEKVFSEDNKEQLVNTFDGVKKQFSKIFSSLKEEHEINLPVEDLPCAVISNIVYDDPFSRPRKIYNYSLIEEHNSIEYCVYRDALQQKFIMWFRWTEPTEARDLITDINILLGTEKFSERFLESEKQFDELAKEFPDDIKVITGHSLWGSICLMIAQQRNPDRTVVFNPWTSANTTFVKMIKDTEQKVDRTRRVFSYKILGDIVSTLSVVGYTRVFRKASIHPWELHAIKNFMPEGWEEETKKLTTSANVKSTEKPVEKEQNSIAEIPKSATKPTEDTTKKSTKSTEKPVEKDQNPIAKLPKSATKLTEDTTKKTKKIYKKSTSKTLKHTKPAKSSKKNT